MSRGLPFSDLITHGGLSLAGHRLGQWLRHRTGIALGETVSRVVSLEAPPLTTAGTPTYEFTVTYGDLPAIAAANLHQDTVTVTNDSGFRQAAHLVATAQEGQGGLLIATYQVSAPAGYWSESDNGTYRIFLEPAAAPPLEIGHFTVTVPALGRYAETLLALTPLTYWPLAETAGTVAVDSAPTPVMAEAGDSAAGPIDSVLPATLPWGAGALSSAIALLGEPSGEPPQLPSGALSPTGEAGFPPLQEALFAGWRPPGPALGDFPTDEGQRIEHQTLVTTRAVPPIPGPATGSFSPVQAANPSAQRPPAAGPIPGSPESLGAVTLPPPAPASPVIASPQPPPVPPGPPDEAPKGPPEAPPTPPVENRPPLATADRYSAIEDTTLTIAAAAGVLSNDSDADGEGLTVSAYESLASAGGSVLLTTDGELTYTPLPDFAGTETFTYTIEDTQGATATATLETPADTPLQGLLSQLLENDSDPDGDLLSLVAVSNAVNGSVSLDETGVNFTPDAGFVGPASFDYTVSDGSATATATVTLTVTPVPTLIHIEAEDYDDFSDNSPGNEGGAYRDEDVDIQETDDQGGGYNVGWIRTGEWLSYTIAPTAAGTYQLRARVASEQPGPFSLKVTVGDESALLNFEGTGNWQTWQTVTQGLLTLEAGEHPLRLDLLSDKFNLNYLELVPVAATPVNTAPSATADTYTVAEDTSLTVSAAGVLSNDVDADRDSLTVSASDTTSMAGGTVTLADDGRFVYTPPPDFVGSDRFSYTITDGQGGSDSATVDLTVTPVNDRPVAAPDRYTTPANQTLAIALSDLLSNDADIEGDNLQVRGVSQPGQGSVAIAGELLTYQADPAFVGSDTFTYTIQDAEGAEASATVTITVTPASEVPTGPLDFSGETQGVLVNLPAARVARLNYGPHFRLMPVGDSITEGWDASYKAAYKEPYKDQFTPGYRDTHEGYRLDLWQQFAALSFPVDFVGSQSHGPDTLGDLDHEGWPGKGFDYFNSDNRIQSYIQAAQPDIMLVMLGTNDGNQKGGEIAAGLSTFLDNILAASDFTGTVLIGSIPPAHPDSQWAFRNNSYTDYNALIPQIIAEKNTDRFTFVEVGSRLDGRADMASLDVDNGLHPNQDGYAKMADAWYDALLEVLIANEESLAAGEGPLIGSDFADVLIGDAADNTLQGGAGEDQLTGNGGRDCFVMASPNEGVDTLTDFAADDVIAAIAAAFGNGLVAGTDLSQQSSGGALVSGSNPNPAGNQATFLYNTNSGLLSYDPDGSGSQNATQLMRLSGAPTLTANQILLV